MNEEPLRDYEIKVLRGMIDEYRQHEQQQRYARKVGTAWKVWLVAIGGILLFTLQVVSLIVALAHPH